MSDHDRIAARFGEVVDAVVDWDAPTPVPEWIARDVVHHLTTWFPEFLAAGGVTIPSGRRDDPVGSWHAQVASVTELLTARGDETFTHPQAGTNTLAETAATFYTPDVMMHTWDLARATGQDDRIDEAMSASVLDGLLAASEMIRASGQFGVEQPVSPDADAQTRLMAFVGRDPQWHPSSHRGPKP